MFLKTNIKYTHENRATTNNSRRADTLVWRERFDVSSRKPSSTISPACLTSIRDVGCAGNYSDITPRIQCHVLTRSSIQNGKIHSMLPMGNVKDWSMPQCTIEDFIILWKKGSDLAPFGPRGCMQSIRTR